MNVKKEQIDQEQHSFTTKFFCRIITENCTAHTEAQIKIHFVDKLTGIGATNINFYPLAPYWKTPEQGEISCHFRSHTPLADIQQLFADTWQNDTADVAWSNIRCPGAVFLWVSQ